MSGDNEEEIVGVLIEKCDLENQPLVFTPCVASQLVDAKTGTSLVQGKPSETTEVVSTTPCKPDLKRPNPVWNQVLLHTNKYEQVCNTKNSNYLFLFELFDYLQESSSVFKPKSKDLVKVRIAWAFLKPVSSNGQLNVGKERRLQLYKIGRNCSLPHSTCPVYHLFSQHKRKKYPGSLFVTVKGVDPPKPDIHPSNGNPHPTDLGVSQQTTETENVQAATEFKVCEWSRLPGQSCKPPNAKYQDVFIDRRGVSCLRFSHCGHFLACGSFSKLLICKITDNKETTRLTGHSGLVYELSWSPDDKMLLSLSADCSAIIWKTKPLSKIPLFVLPHPSFVYCGKWLNDGRRLVTGGRDARIRCWSQNNNGCELVSELPGHEGFISALETEGVVLSGDSLGNVIIWNSEGSKWTMTKKVAMKKAGVIDAIHMHPAKRRIVVSTRNQGSSMIDLATGVTLRNYPSGLLRARSVSCLSPCGSLFFSFNSENVVNVWQFETGKLLASYSSIFPGVSASTAELSSCITYHPHEHMIALSILGCNAPVVVLNFHYEKNDADLLGLVMAEEKKNFEETSSDTKNLFLDSSKGNLIEMEDESASGRGGNMEEKLSAIVRNIDRILALRRDRPARVSPSSTLRKIK